MPIGRTVIATRATLTPYSSRVPKRRQPKVCDSEFTLKVACQSRTVEPKKLNTTPLHPAGRGGDGLSRSAIDRRLLQHIVGQADLAALHFDDLMLAGLQLAGLRNDVTAHL